MAKKNGTKAKAKVGKKKGAAKTKSVRHEVVLRVQQSQLPVLATPTQQELAEPIRNVEGKNTKLTIPSTWLSSAQILRLVEKTPTNQIYRRPGKGGKTWDYVTVSYIQRVLDYTFGWSWNFEIVEHGKEADHVWVRGRLTVENPEGTRRIVKEQFGRSDVKQKSAEKGGGNLDYGNDLKAASSDALKKCASMLGIARDIYGKTDYQAETGREPKPTPAAPVAAQPAKEPETEVHYQCVGAHNKGCEYGTDSVSETVASYSKKRYGKVLCGDCQKDAKPMK